MDETELSAAAAGAVSRSAPLARRLARELAQTERSVSRRTALPDAAALTEEQRALADEDRRLRLRAVGLLRELTGGRLRALDTFNVVLFGRTGTGKSSLVDALTGGDGARISPGRADFTTTVDEVRWAGLRLFDTPGTNGWGSDGDNRHLEEAARQAVLLADVVLLCFDDDSQLEGEFTKVAQWVLAYRKPAVVVLNCRTRPWRDPDRVARRRMRLHLSTAVAQHAAHIREWLGACGLPHVPVVALSAQRAVAARAAAPYLGEDKGTIRRMQKQTGRPTLLRRSNLPALETLLAQAVGTDAAQLRYGGLLTQTAGVLSGLADELDRTLATPARKGAAEIETGLEELLRVLGLPQGPGDAGTAPEGAAAPGPAGRDGRPDDYAAMVRALGELQRLRGGPFAVPARAEARIHLDHLLTGAFGKLRTTLEARAEDLVDKAFRERKALSAEDFNAAVFKPAELTAVVEGAVTSFTTHLESRVSLVAADLKAGLNAVNAQVEGVGEDVRGDAGARSRAFGRGAGYTSVGAGLTSAGLTVASVVFLSNPVGWVAAAGLAAVTAGARLAARLGVRRGERQREGARADHREQAREAVHQQVDVLRERVVEHCVGIARRAVLTEAGPLVHQAVALRRIADAASGDTALLRATVDGLPQGRDAADILAQAMRRAEAAAGLDRPSEADRLWLGSDWCDDPHNLVADADDGPAAGRGGRPPRFAPNILDRMRQVFRRGPGGPVPGAGLEWLGLLHQEFAHDPHTARVLAELDALAADPRPRIAVAGNLSAGKSAFVHRLLVESGQPVPESLTSAAGPETWRAEHYAWEGLLLVDTPGFQSGREGHTEAARAALADAAAVIHLFSPLVRVGERADLMLLLRGAPESGRFSKQGRILWVVNKVDLIAVAEDAPDLRAHVAHAEDELAAALEGLAPAPAGGPPHRDRIVSMAAAPYGLRSADRRDYDDFRAWDGFRDFAASVRELRSTLEPNALDITLLHGGAARLGELRSRALRQAELLERRIAETGRLADEAANGALVGRGLVATMTGGAERLAVSCTSRLVHETFEAGLDAPGRKARGKRLESWVGDKEFAGAWKRHRASSEREAQEWLASVADAMERRTASPAYALAFPEPEHRADLSFLDEESFRFRSREILTHTTAGLTPVGALRPDDVAALAAHFDVAVDAAHLDDLLDGVNDVGVILKIANAVSLLGALRAEADREAKLEASRADLLKTMRASARAWAEGVRGGCGAVEDVCVRLEELVVRLTEQQSTLLGELTAARRRAERCTAAIEGARLRLGDTAPDGGRAGGDGRDRRG